MNSTKTFIQCSKISYRNTKKIYGECGLFIFFTDKFVTSIRNYRLRDVGPPNKKIGMHIELFWRLIFTKAKVYGLKWCIQNPVKHLRWSVLRKQRFPAFNYFRKTLHLRCLIGFLLSFLTRT